MSAVTLPAAGTRVAARAAARSTGFALAQGRPCLHARARPARGPAPRRVAEAEDVSVSDGVAAAREALRATEGTFQSFVLEPKEVLMRLQSAVPAHAAYNHAMYSSVVGGITTEPALMTVPVDDRSVLLGHAACGSVDLVNGHLFNVDPVLEDFLDAAELAGIAPPLSAAQLRRIILDTAAASLKLNGVVRFWLTGGRSAPSQVSGHGVEEAGFYVLVSSEPAARGNEQHDLAEGWAVVTTPVPAPDAYFGAFEHTNRLRDVLAVMNAEDASARQAVHVDDNGNVLHAAGLGVGIITAERKMIIPTDSARSMSMRLVMALVDELQTAVTDGVSGVEVRDVSTEEAKAAAEVFLVGGHIPVVGVTSWDEEPVGDGAPGEITLALCATLCNAASPEFYNAMHTPVPYGALTGMRGDASQLG